MTYWNLWDTAMAVLRGKFIAMSAYFRKTEISQINDLKLHLKHLEIQEQANPITNRNRNKQKKTYKELMKQKSWFFEKINKINRPFTNLTKMRREKNQNQ
jgi:hypothetical protein